MESYNSSAQIKKLITDIRTLNLRINKTKFINNLDELDRFVGLESEKMEIISNIKSVIYQKKHNILGEGDNTPLIGLFLGEPGSGKTELSKIWGKLLISVLKEEKKIENNDNKINYYPFFKVGLYFILTFLLFYALACFISNTMKLISGKNNNFVLWAFLIIFILILYIMLSLDIKDSDFKYVYDKFNKDLIKYFNIRNMQNVNEYIKEKNTSDDDYIIATKDRLVAGYVGQTAIKTKRFLEENKDKAILIDEVYNLLNSTEHNSFGLECITTIMEFIDKNPYAVIGLIGYEDQTKNGVLHSQPGLIRRCGMKVVFKQPTYEDLYNIFIRKLENEKLSLKENSLCRIKKYFKDNREYFIHHGGDIKLLVSYIKDKIANEHFNDDKKCNEVNIDYFKEAMYKIVKTNSNFIKEKGNQLYDKFVNYMKNSNNKTEDLINLNP